MVNLVALFQCRLFDNFIKTFEFTIPRFASKIKSKIFLKFFHIFNLIGGRYWDRTSDPFHVKEVLYR